MSAPWPDVVAFTCIGLLVLQLSACKPTAPEPQLLGGQRNALQQANELGPQMQQQLETRMQAADSQQK